MSPGAAGGHLTSWTVLLLRLLLWGRSVQGGKHCPAAVGQKSLHLAHANKMPLVFGGGGTFE